MGEGLDFHRLAVVKYKRLQSMQVPYPGQLNH